MLNNEKNSIRNRHMTEDCTQSYEVLDKFKNLLSTGECSISKKLGKDITNNDTDKDNDVRGLITNINNVQGENEQLNTFYERTILYLIRLGKSIVRVYSDDVDRNIIIRILNDYYNINYSNTLTKEKVQKIIMNYI